MTVSSVLLELLKPSDDLVTAVITLHQFGTADGATTALQAFVSSDEGNGWESGQSDTPEVEFLTLRSDGNGIIPDGLDVIVYLQLGETVAQIRGFAFGGDPTAETLELARRLYDPGYRATAQELREQISTLESAASQIYDLEQSVQTELDDVSNVVDELQTSLEDLQSQANEPLDCYSLEGLAFSYEDAMGFTYGDSLSWEQGQYGDAADAMDSVVDTLEFSATPAIETVETLSTLRSSMPAPLLEATDTLFNEDVAIIGAFTSDASQGRETLNDLDAQYEEEIAVAESVMEDGAGIVTEAEESLSC